MGELTQGTKMFLKTVSTDGVYYELQYEISITNY